MGLITRGAGKIGRTRDFSSVVDPDGFRVVSAECAEVSHYSVGPEEGMVLRIAREGRETNDVSRAINALCGTDGATKIAEVGHDTVLPQERIEGRHSCR